MASLPNFQSDDQVFQLMQNAWASAINPVLSNPTVQGLTLKGVSLVVGLNVINHKLGRKLQGWSIVRKRGPSDIYDTQDSNSMPDLTLTLQSSAAVVVDIYVY